MNRHELIYVGGGHRKFWTVETNGATMTCTWGRMGTAGQKKSWAFATPSAAQIEAESKLREKLAKGYVDASGTGTVPQGPGPAAAPDVTDEEMAAARSTLEGVMAELEDG